MSLMSTRQWLWLMSILTVTCLGLAILLWDAPGPRCGIALAATALSTLCTMIALSDCIEEEFWKR